MGGWSYGERQSRIIDCESAGSIQNIYQSLPATTVKLNWPRSDKTNVTTFTYIGSMFDAEGVSTADCKNRVRLTWNE